LRRHLLGASQFTLGLECVSLLRLKSRDNESSAHRDSTLNIDFPIVTMTIAQIAWNGCFPSQSDQDLQMDCTTGVDAEIMLMASRELMPAAKLSVPGAGIHCWLTGMNPSGHWRASRQMERH
jgi:hypothetical protein